MSAKCPPSVHQVSAKCPEDIMELSTKDVHQVSAKCPPSAPGHKESSTKVVRQVSAKCPQDIRAPEQRLFTKFPPSVRQVPQAYSLQPKP